MKGYTKINSDKVHKALVNWEEIKKTLDNLLSNYDSIMEAAGKQRAKDNSLRYKLGFKNWAEQSYIKDLKDGEFLLTRLEKLSPYYMEEKFTTPILKPYSFLAVEQCDLFIKEYYAVFALLESARMPEEILYDDELARFVNRFSSLPENFMMGE